MVIRDQDPLSKGRKKQKNWTLKNTVFNGIFRFLQMTRNLKNIRKQKMKKIILVISLMISLVLSSAEKTGFIQEILAKNDGFASEGKGTTGGAGAVQKNIFKVTNKKEFVADIEGRDYKDFVKVFGGEELTTVNNIFNGQKIDKFDESLIKVDWTPTLYQKIDATNKVKEKVLNNAGVFKNKM